MCFFLSVHTTLAGSNQAGSFMCSGPNLKDVLRVETIDPNFPYGSAPVGNVCVSSDYYATPETMKRRFQPP